MNLKKYNFEIKICNYSNFQISNLSILKNILKILLIIHTNMRRDRIQYDDPFHWQFPNRNQTMMLQSINQRDVGLMDRKGFVKP